MWPDCQHDPTGLALLQGCKDHPDDTDRRLILADWLEDQGEQEVARCAQQSLQNPGEWFAFPVPVIARWRPLAGCREGLPGVVGGPDRLRDSPWCCAWTCYGCGNRLKELPAVLASPVLAPLVALKLQMLGLDDATVAVLAENPHLGYLTTLFLAYNRIGPHGAKALAESPHLPNLRHLVLHHNPLGTSGVRELSALSQRGVTVTC